MQPNLIESGRDRAKKNILSRKPEQIQKLKQGYLPNNIIAGNRMEVALK